MSELLSIFGKPVRLTLDDSPASAILERELRLYPAAPPGTEQYTEILLATPDTSTAGLVNPAIHHELEDGFITAFGPATVRWVLKEGRLTQIEFQLSTAGATGKAQWAQRMISNQFTSRAEAIGQIFHELVLIPAVYFDPTRFLLHASGLQAPDGGVTLIGGTGGVGKTSLELELCRNHGYRFVADDIAVVDQNGHVWPNLAFPKIYGYNLESDDALRDLVIGNGGWENRLNWNLHRMRGPSRVRRRISPTDLYPAYSRDGGPLRRYLFIAREFRNDVSVEPASGALLASLSAAVMDAEYHAFHNHLTWHRMNRLLMDEPPLITRDVVLERWRKLATEVLDKVECIVIRAPRSMDHKEFKQRMVAVITGAQAEV